jgi:predicted RNase H-like HicB family nuclease
MSERNQMYNDVGCRCFPCPECSQLHRALEHGEGVRCRTCGCYLEHWGSELKVTPQIRFEWMAKSVGQARLVRLRDRIMVGYSDEDKGWIAAAYDIDGATGFGDTPSIALEQLLIALWGVSTVEEE